jgi:hypothetical protein
MGFAGKLAERARKHVGDMKTVKTRKQVQTEEATKGQRTFREGERSGVVVGGAGGAAVATAAIKE